jgi:hypothetical protein
LLGLTEFGISACFDPQNSHGLSFASYDPCSEQRHLQVRADVTVSCRGRRLHPVKKMPNKDDSQLFHRSSVARSDCGAEVGAADDEHEEEEEEEEEERPLAHQVDATLALALAVTEPQLSVR